MTCQDCNLKVGSGRAGAYVKVVTRLRLREGSHDATESGQVVTGALGVFVRLRGGFMTLTTAARRPSPVNVLIVSVDAGLTRALDLGCYQGR